MSPKTDKSFMARAIALARRAEGRTSPNPPVGAVVVKNGAIIGQGWHKAAGQPHAEPMALDQASRASRGAELYVTLEPCNHTGQTPPCTTRIIQAGISKVVIGSLDPNPKVAGGGLARLEQAGIKVQSGILKQRCDDLLAPFARHVATGRPWVVLKMAASLDGRISTRPGISQWLTGPEALTWAYRLRNISEAVLIGAGTAAVDDPALTTRLKRGPRRDALRVILDSKAQTDPRAKAVTGPRQGSPTGGGCLVITGPQAPEERIFALQKAGAMVEKLAGDDQGRPEPAAVLDLLGARGVMRLMVEGGPTLAGALLRAGLVDEFFLIMAPLVMGGKGAAPVITGPNIDDLSGAINLTWRSTRRLGRDLLLRAMVTK